MSSTTSAEKTTTTKTTTTCHGCQQEFPSRNAVFKHLEATNGACLNPSDYKDFCKFHDTSKRNSKKNKNHYERVLIIYGYLPELSDDEDDGDDDGVVVSKPSIIRNGHDAAELLLEIIWQVDNHHKNNGQEKEDASDDNEEDQTSFPYQRSYGHSNRQTHIVAQDDGTGAVSEVMATKLLPLLRVQVPVVGVVQPTPLQNEKDNNDDNNDQKSSTTTATTTGSNNALIVGDKFCHCPLSRGFRVKK